MEELINKMILYKKQYISWNIRIVTTGTHEAGRAIATMLRGEECHMCIEDDCDEALKRCIKEWEEGKRERLDIQRFTQLSPEVKEETKKSIMQRLFR